MDIDDYTLQKISKKYTTATRKTWEQPSADVVKAVEAILQINKAKALEPLERSKRLNRASTQLTMFIEEFVARLARAKMPKNLDSRDFNYDYQCQREKFLQNLYSQELAMVDKLHDALDDEEAQLDDLKKYVSSYEQMYKEELRKLEELDGSDVVKKVKRHELNEVKSLDLSNDDQELKEVLDELDAHLSKLDERFDPLQELSNELDELLEMLS